MLGDPAGATAQEGRELIEAMAQDIVGRLRRWAPDGVDCSPRPYLQPSPASMRTIPARGHEPARPTAVVTGPPVGWVPPWLCGWRRGAGG